MKTRYLSILATLAFVTGSLTMPATAYAHHCQGGHANDPGCDPGGDPVTYTAELTGRVFHFGSLPVTPDRKEENLFPDPAVPLTFFRPLDTDPDAQDAWDAVFDACENFFGPNPINMGPTPIVVSKFTVPADNWKIGKFGGVRVALPKIPFDISGNSPPTEGPLYAEVTLQLIGDTLFDSPNAPWLPVPGLSNPAEYDMIESWIIGKTAKGVHPKVGCVSGGSAPSVPFDSGLESTLVITATAQ